MVLLCTVLAGCVGHETVESATGERFARSPNGLLDYANYLRELNAEQLQREKELVEARDRHGQEVYERIRLALLLMQPEAGFTNYARAEALLKSDTSERNAEPPHRPSTFTSPGDGDYRSLALFLLARVDERRKMQQLASQLARERQKIEELRAIEKHLNDMGTW